MATGQSGKNEGQQIPVKDAELKIAEATDKTSCQRKSTCLTMEADKQEVENGDQWDLWGPYLSERHWGTVREDRSADGNCWDYFPHDHAVFRTYQSGEDGLLGICDKSARLCFATALWNGQDAILKERLFGLNNQEGNHGEDVKEVYFYLDSTPSHSYMKALYKYPQSAYPHEQLRSENKDRGLADEEYELLDTGIFDGNRYWDVQVEYGKATPADILVNYTISNRGESTSELHLLPTIWYRNTWSRPGGGAKPQMMLQQDGVVECKHEELGTYYFTADVGPDGKSPEYLLTHNESNIDRLEGRAVGEVHKKDAFHQYIIRGRKTAVKASKTGTKCAAHYVLSVPGGETVVVRCRFKKSDTKPTPTGFIEDFSEILSQNRGEAEKFYLTCPLTGGEGMSRQQRLVARQACAGLLWTKQYYQYNVEDQMKETCNHNHINKDWKHFDAHDVIHMPDKWEFPWFASWDLAFHMVPFAHLDAAFAKNQLRLLLSDRFLHPSGQLPAYEFNLSDTNPPVLAWSCMQVFRGSGANDFTFLKHVFHRLQLNFSWWVNKKSVAGHPHLYSGGFLGLDNISAVDRSIPPADTTIIQADGTGWMAMYCLNMLDMALTLASCDAHYEDIAVYFLHQYLHIVDALADLWHKKDGFFYDKLFHGGKQHILEIRSYVGIIPVFAVQFISNEVLKQRPAFKSALDTCIEKRKGSKSGILRNDDGVLLLPVPATDLQRILDYVIDPVEFLSPYGIRSLSKIHSKPYRLQLDKEVYEIQYCPGESTSPMFGGNSNWRGPIWICINYLLVTSLQVYGTFFKDKVTLTSVGGSQRQMSLCDVASMVAQRISHIFLPDEHGMRPCHGKEERYTKDPHWQDLVLFYEYFHGDTGRGCGASHQTGWSALVATLLKSLE